MSNMKLLLCNNSCWWIDCVEKETYFSIKKNWCLTRFPIQLSQFIYLMLVPNYKVQTLFRMYEYEKVLYTCFVHKIISEYIQYLFLIWYLFVQYVDHNMKWKKKWAERCTFINCGAVSWHDTYVFLSTKWVNWT